MANMNPRRRTTPGPKEKTGISEGRWAEGDPAKKVAINCPFPEPTMLQLEWLIENNFIHSKASFIREVVAAAATREVERAKKIRAFVEKLDAQEAAKTK
ncbi:hypothetical protein [Caballeronia zhejiangensis]|uniref:Uncharacterized protein n=1 Tax=Caballeronia zhejiangensis TaxID=871203 RepID=A0A656QAX8_9BURK|nr:hypothetical protein [Caballeronia zhejiangensis]KDR25970.1 hypothetical protein BG60_26535 [Caballeronia zhejiangensis]